MRELSLHILDVLQNAIEAGATLVKLTIEEDLASDWLTIVVDDNGRGIPADMASHVFDPFYTSRKTRHVGLGLPLFKAAAERCEGDVRIVPNVEIGMMLTATFRHSHIDRAPLGDITTTLLSFILGGTCDLHYVHRMITGKQSKREIRKFGFHTVEIRAELGDVPLAHPVVRQWLQAFIAAGEAEL